MNCTGELTNAGVPAWTSYESLINFEFRVVEVDPDILVIYEGLNDSLARVVWPREAYAVDNSGAREPVPYSQQSSVMEWADSSAALRLVLTRTGLRQPLQPFGTFYNTPASFWGDALLRQLRAGSYPNGVLAEVGLSRILEANSTAPFRRNLRHLIALARDRGITPVLLTVKHARFSDSTVLFAAKEIGLLVDQANEAVRAVAGEQRVSLLDFERTFPDDETWFADGVHVNEAGARLMAETIGRYLIDEMPEKLKRAYRMPPDNPTTK